MVRIAAFSGDFRHGQIVPWAQYWAWLLSGVAAAEVTSLGCHTDLWRPYDHAPSDLAVRRGWAERLAPLTPASAVLGDAQPEWVEATGLSAGWRCIAGCTIRTLRCSRQEVIRSMQGHDATVLSTGTWFVAMRTPHPNDPARDRLAAGGPRLSGECRCRRHAHSVRTFMGGREIEILAGAELRARRASADERCCADAANHRAARFRRSRRRGPTLDPALRRRRASDPSQRPAHSAEPQCQRVMRRRRRRISTRRSSPMSRSISSAVAIRIFVDGRFSCSPIFVAALAALRPNTAVLVSDEDDGVARGALRLVNPKFGRSSPAHRVTPLPIDITQYRARWREAAERLT